MLLPRQAALPMAGGAGGKHVIIRCRNPSSFHRFERRQLGQWRAGRSRQQRDGERSGADRCRAARWRRQRHGCRAAGFDRHQQHDRPRPHRARRTVPAAVRQRARAARSFLQERACSRSLASIFCAFRSMSHRHMRRISAQGRKRRYWSASFPMPNSSAPSRVRRAPSTRSHGPC